MTDQDISTPLPTKPFARGLHHLAQGVAYIAAAALVALVIVQAWQVFARYALNHSPGWTEPVTVLLLSTAMSLAAASAVHSNRHFSFSLLADSTGGTVKRAMSMVSELVVIVIGVLLAIGAARLWLDGLAIHTAGAPLLSQGAPYLPLCVGGACMALFSGQRLLVLARSSANGEG